MRYHLAVDIGASSGRHIVGWVEDGRIHTKEVYRFENKIEKKDGVLTWDVDALVSEVKAGLRAAAEEGLRPDTVAIDTWGVDYVLLDEKGSPLYPCVCYRDSRTLKAIDEVHSVVSYEELYARTGIQQQTFNTVYQLYCDKTSGKLDKAAAFLMMPDYLGYALTGIAAQEYTNATTGALVNAETKTWDEEILSRLGLPARLFGKLALPGTALGAFSEETAKEVGFTALVVHAPSHDTAAAVAACPLPEDGVYISSGTWSLIGTENRLPVLTNAAAVAGFTNEGGVEYRFRFLKNVTGMWAFQNIRRELGGSAGYEEMMHWAMESDFSRTIDLTHPSLLAPESMLSAIRALLGDEALPVKDVLKAVYLSLARAYDETVRQIETLSGKTVPAILIVGGGSKDRYLNRLTSEISGKPVVTGLTEATALGNLLSQIMYAESIDLTAARALVEKTFEMTTTGADSVGSEK